MGFSVGRSTAGTYKGDLGGRICVTRGCRCGGRFHDMRGEVGEVSKGVPEADVGGVYWPCGIYRGCCWPMLCRGDGAATGTCGGGRVATMVEV